MNELDALTLDGKEYVIVDEVTVNGVLYVHLANPLNPKDFCIQKVINVDNKRMIINLDNAEEFDMALAMFADKNSTNQAI